MVQQPNRDNEQGEDDRCYDHGHEDVDASARKVAHFGVARFRGGFLARRKAQLGWKWEGRLWGEKRGGVIFRGNGRAKVGFKYLGAEEQLQYISFCLLQGN